MEGKNRKLAHIKYNKRNHNSEVSDFLLIRFLDFTDLNVIKWRDINKFLQNRNHAGINNENELLDSYKKQMLEFHLKICG